MVFRHDAQTFALLAGSFSSLSVAEGLGNDSYRRGFKFLILTFKLFLRGSPIGTVT